MEEISGKAMIFKGSRGNLVFCLHASNKETEHPTIRHLMSREQSRRCSHDTEAHTTATHGAE